MKHTIVTVIGARPQFIKAAPLSRIFTQMDVNELLVHTGQHYDDPMSGVFFKELEIPAPRYHLNVGSASHAKQTGEMMARLEDVLVAERPDIVIVYGDTNSTAAGALTASKLCIPVAHIEAGLRSFNRRMPEELNRIIADHLSSILFAPTRQAVSNLLQEGICQHVVKTGDLMFDATLLFAEKAERKSELLKKLGVTKGSYVLATIHRAENTDDQNRLSNIFTALDMIAGDIPVILPLHPRTGKMISMYAIREKLKYIRLIEPVGYLEMALLESHSKCIVTDSGGVQKEAYFHKVPCVTLRDETEWVETVTSGWNILANMSDSYSIAESVRQSVAIPSENLPSIDDYGKGAAAMEIQEALAMFLTGRPPVQR